MTQTRPPSGLTGPDARAGRRSALGTSTALQPALHATMARAVITAISVFVALFLVWSHFAPVHQVVSGQGVVKPDQPSHRVQYRHDGVVERAFVAPGDRVAAGDPLLSFDTRDIASERTRLAARLDLVSAREARLRDILAIDILKPGGRRQAETRLAGRDLDRALADELRFLLAQAHVWEARHAASLAERDILTQRLETLRDDRQILQEQVTRMAIMVDRGIAARPVLEDLQREALRLEEDIQRLAGEIAREARDAERTLLEFAELVMEHRRQTRLALEEVANERLDLAERLAIAEERLRDAMIVAPIGGTINAIGADTTGTVLAGGQLLAEIIPEGTGLYVEIQVPADRIGGIAVGQSASVKVLTFDFTRFGDLATFVDRIAPSSSPDENGAQMFWVRLAFDSALSGQPELLARISPGMTVSADIVTDTRTVLSFLLKPLRLLQDQALTEA
ncbi:MAG: HlyD family type I secretion periplasmic adaptor subunit [Roseicyclus sp.]